MKMKNPQQSIDNKVDTYINYRDKEFFKGRYATDWLFYIKKRQSYVNSQKAVNDGSHHHRSWRWRVKSWVLLVLTRRR
jgi:hypothetical protein